MPELTDALLSLSHVPNHVSEEVFSVVERFVVLMYSRISETTSINEARQQMFSRGSRSIENIPPTQNALLQHTKRAVLQAGHVWAQCLVSEQQLPCPSEWGWEQIEDTWQPCWTTIQEASKACCELVHCNCTKGCQKRCKCKKASLTCTALCKCSGQCS